MDKIGAQKYPFTLTPLPYGYTGLEPFIDARTMMLHHDRHLGTYIDNLNKYLETHAQMQELTLEQLIRQFPHDEQIRHNAGGVWNHEFYFSSLRPGMSQIVVGLSTRLIQMLTRDFGGLGQMEERLAAAAMSVFGSGYAWLVVTPNGTLDIVTTANQDTPLTLGVCPLLGIDVWEHAYYLKHYNLRADYLKDFWNVVDWVKVSARLEECIRGSAVTF